ncbi:MarR family transcriptional regulator [Gordonia sp. TBRC 11910]|uniref:MarR family transcriptional regulator n=1 Tax=Gordonia asplenii TaxID=2725283 RepID=A0A848L3P3_9ACTN|nr:MarR family transcriptional regulator [Gordonia asplenii]NMO03201.1 MarR family transcriptional regulator [Gordonia asplenii]
MSTQSDAPEYSSDLDDQMCFALYAASRAVTALYRPVLDKLGLTYPQYLVMLVLWQQGAVPVKDLALALHLEYGTLTPMLKRLEAAGVIRRERSIADERVVMIVLTDAGVELRSRAKDVPAYIGAGMDLEPVEFADLRAALRKLTANVERATEEAASAPAG